MPSGNDPLDGITPRDVADELVRARRRGLARLDATLGSEPAVALPVLDRLSSRGQRASSDRGVAIGTLLRSGIAVLRAGRPEDARLVVELFFGDPAARIPTLSPGDLLDAAVRRRRGMNEAAFRRERRQVYLRLGRVLLDIALEREAPAEPGAPLAAPSRDAPRRDDVGEVLDLVTRFDTPDVLG